MDAVTASTPLKKIKPYAMLQRLPKDAVYAKIESPVGKLTFIASDSGLHALTWNDDQLSTEFLSTISHLNHQQNHPVVLEAASQLNEYFQGTRKDFDLPLCLDGTDFQLEAWNELRRIPYGKTISYEEQAIALGDKNRMRAVAGANGRNPISIIVPCHRVIAKNGKLQGFGGGLKIKEILLNLERENTP